jgi:DHA2 family multidrug resistance protein
VSASIAFTGGRGPAVAPLPFRVWLGMAAGLIGSFMALLNTQTTAFAVADIRGGIHAGFDEGAWITTAYSVGELAIIPVTAALSVVFTTRF